MTNTEMTVEGNVLTIKVKLSEQHGPSASGKTVIIATTGGNADIEGHPGVKCGVNVYRSK